MTAAIINDQTKEDYFFCDQARCLLKYKNCVKRQHMNRRTPNYMPVPFLVCEGCEQGQENQRLTVSGEPMSLGQPVIGEGGKKLNCFLYDSCLNLAAHEDWDSFNCESCPQAKPVVNDTKSPSQTKPGLCADCGKARPISPHVEYCWNCMLKRNAESKVLKQAQAWDEDQDTVDENPCNNIQTVFRLDFDDEVPVLEAIEKLAEDESRPVEQQIMMMLKNQISSVQDLRTI